MKKRYFPYILAASAALVTVAVFARTLRNDFINWDDGLYVVDNPNIRSFGLRFLDWALTDISSVVYWQPLTWISYALDYLFWGGDPFGYHLTNTLLHAFNTAVVVLLVIRLLETAKPRAFTGQAVLIAAGMTGLLFGLHPLRVESVAWVSERKDLLFALFYLLSIMAYLRYAMPAGEVTEKGPPGNVLLNRHYLLSLGWYVCSVASKPMAVTLPAVLLLLDWHPFGRAASWKSLRQLVWEKAPFILISIGVSVLTIIGQRNVDAMVSFQVLPLSARAATAIRGIATYLAKMAAPYDLVPLYPYPRRIDFFSFEYVSALLLVCGISALCVLFLKRLRTVAAAWMYFVVTLFPVLGFFQAGSHSLADRFTYLPSLGPSLLVGLLAAREWETLQAGKRRRAARFVAGLLVVTVFSVYSYASVRQIDIWRNSVTFWTYVLQKEPGQVPVAYMNRGLAFRAERRFEKAIEDFAAVIAGGYSPVDTSIAYNLRGETLVDMGLPKQGVEDFTAAIALEPSRHLAYSNRGLALGKMGRYREALEDLNMSLSLNPADDTAYVGRGLVFAEMGQLDRASGDLDKALVLNTSNTDAYLNRGLVYERKGMPERALADYSRAIELRPDDYLAYVNRGVVYARAGSYDQALEDLSRAVTLKPDFAEAFQERAAVFLKSGRADLAARDYRTACGLGSADGCAAARTISGNQSGSSDAGPAKLR